MILQQVTLLAAITYQSVITVNAHDISFERGRLCVVVATVVINVVTKPRQTYGAIIREIVTTYRRG
jgi:branched-subunit amino acid transport protein